MDKIREELADVCGLDMDEIIQKNVKQNNEKYPVEKVYRSKEKYTELKLGRASIY